MQKDLKLPAIIGLSAAATSCAHSPAMTAHMLMSERININGLTP
jgi:hypothetical protein